MRWLVASLTLAAAVAAALLLTPAAGAAAIKCPTGGTPAPGSTINGGLEVDGFECKLDHVTVNGGITVDGNGTGAFPIGYAALSGSTVNGGIVVNGGAIDIGVDDFFVFNRTHEPSTITGGLRLNHPLFFTSADATIRGGATMDGQRDPTDIFGGPIPSQLCGNSIFGDVAVTDASHATVYIGDPGEPFYGNGAFCDANTIHGSVFLTNSNFTNPNNGEGQEIEGDTVTGSVHVDHSTAEVFSNTIGGSLLCTNGSVMQPPLPGDPSSSPNTVGGVNTCF